MANTEVKIWDTKAKLYLATAIIVASVEYGPRWIERFHEWQNTRHQTPSQLEMKAQTTPAPVDYHMSTHEVAKPSHAKTPNYTLQR